MPPSPLSQDSDGVILEPSAMSKAEKPRQRYADEMKPETANSSGGPLLSTNSDWGSSDLMDPPGASASTGAENSGKKPSDTPSKTNQPMPSVSSEDLPCSTNSTWNEMGLEPYASSVDTNIDRAPTVPSGTPNFPFHSQSREDQIETSHSINLSSTEPKDTYTSEMHQSEPSEPSIGHPCSNNNDWNKIKLDASPSASADRGTENRSNSCQLRGIKISQLRCGRPTAQGHLTSAGEGCACFSKPPDTDPNIKVQPELRDGFRNRDRAEAIPKTVYRDAPSVRPRTVERQRCVGAERRSKKDTGAKDNTNLKTSKDHPETHRRTDGGRTVVTQSKPGKIKDLALSMAVNEPESNEWFRKMG